MVFVLRHGFKCWLRDLFYQWKIKNKNIIVLGFQQHGLLDSASVMMMMMIIITQSIFISEKLAVIGACDPCGFCFRLMMTMMWTIIVLTHVYLTATHQSSQMVRGVRPPHTPHYQTCAAAQRRFPADEEEKENWMSKIKKATDKRKMGWERERA